MAELNRFLHDTILGFWAEGVCDESGGSAEGPRGHVIALHHGGGVITPVDGEPMDVPPGSWVVRTSSDGFTALEGPMSRSDASNEVRLANEWLKEEGEG